MATETAVWKNRQQESPRDKRDSIRLPNSGAERGDELEQGLMETEGSVHYHSNSDAKSDVTKGQAEAVETPPKRLHGIYASLATTLVLSAAASLPG